MKNCEICKNYSPLKEQRIVNDECTVYGFCFKDFMRNGMMSTYPVYIPESSCKKFVKASGIKQQIECENENLEGQMDITDFPGCCHERHSRTDKPYRFI